MDCIESDDWTNLDPRELGLAAATAAPWKQTSALVFTKLECRFVFSKGSKQNSGWPVGASQPSFTTARKAVAIDRPFLGQDSGPAGCGARDTFAWSPRDHTQLREHVPFDPTMAGCAFYYHPSTPNQAPAEDMRGFGKASSATMDAWEKAKVTARASYKEYLAAESLAAAPLCVKTRRTNRLRDALIIKGKTSRGGGVSKSSTIAKGVPLGWTGPMRGSARKSVKTRSTKVKPATSSSAIDVEPPTEEGAPPTAAAAGAAGGAFEGAEAAVAGVAKGRAFAIEPVDMELPVDETSVNAFLGKPGDNPPFLPPPNTPEERPVRVLFKNLSGKTFSLSIKGGTTFRELSAETAAVCEGGSVWFDVPATGRTPFEPDDLVPKYLPVDAEVRIVGRMRGAGPMLPSVPKPTHDYIKSCRQKNVPKPSPPSENQWAIGIEGGNAVPWVATEGVFRGLNAILVKTPDNPKKPLLETPAFVLSESGSTVPIVALSYSDYERPHLLQMERAADGHGVPQYDFGPNSDTSNPAGLRLDGNISHTAIGYASTQQALCGEGACMVCAYCCPCCVPRCCLAFPRALCGPRNSVLAGLWNCMTGVTALELMGVNGFARTASGDDAIKEAVGQSCCCLCDSEFVVAKKPPAYINFRFSGPGGNTSAGSSTYTELALGLDRAIRQNTVYGEAIEGYDEPPFAPTGAYAPEMRAIPDTKAVTKLRNEKYSGVTAMLFTATPDTVETMYFGGPVPEYSSGCCSGWAALPFPSVSLSPHPSMTVPSVKFNRGNFRLKDAVAAGTNALTGGLSDLIISKILGCPPFKWLPQRTQECISRNLKYSSNQSFYGWPDGDTSKVATKLLFDDAGYFPSPRVGPAIARGVNKVMIVSFYSFVVSILPLFGLPYVRDQAYLAGAPWGGSGNDIPPAAYPSMAKIFDAGDPVSVDGYSDVMNGPYAPPRIYTAPDVVEPVTHFPQKAMDALRQATKQFKSETGPVKGFLQDGVWKRSGPEIIVLKGLDVVDNQYHGTHGGRTADLLVYVYPAHYAGFMPTQWTAPGATNLGTWNGEAFPGYEGFPSYASSNFYGAPLLPDIANLSADLACWSMVSQAATIAEFAGPYDLADD